MRDMTLAQFAIIYIFVMYNNTVLPDRVWGTTRYSVCDFWIMNLSGIRHGVHGSIRQTPGFWGESSVAHKEAQAWKTPDSTRCCWASIFRGGSAGDRWTWRRSVSTCGLRKRRGGGFFAGGGG